MGLSRARISRAKRRGRLLVRFEGEFGNRHSFGHVSRQMALALLSRPEIELRLIVVGPTDFRLEDDEASRPLFGHVDPDPEEEVDFHIRHHWPPNLEAPPSGRWILAQPWEYGSLPQEWVDAFRDDVDDAWCFTRYVRDAFQRAGFPDDRIPIVPHGIDPDVFRPDVEPLPLPTQKRFKFLYVGGTLERKGADLALETYLRTFSRRDDVSLIVKDFGTQTFYRGKTIHEQFLKAIRDGTRAEIVYLDGYMPDGELARLYRACDVLVAPYRGEGFALPVLEAMACGLHVIATGGGATDDFLDGTCGSRIISDKRETTNVMSDGLRCVAPMFCMEPDSEEFGKLLLWAYEHPHIGKRLGEAASRRARREWTWSRVADVIVRRLRALSERPIRRFIAASASQSDEPHQELEGERASDAEDPGRLRALELCLMKGDLGLSREYLHELASKEVIDSAARAVLELAEKSLAAEKGLVLKGLSEEERTSLLKSVREALGRVATSEPIGVGTVRPRVSLTMIVRDEEANIADCLRCVRDLVDEMVVVDTGSRDRTKTIASALGAKVFDFPWVDSFARARNEALWRSGGDWVFWLDADDRVDAVNRARLKSVFSGLSHGRLVGYSMKVECVAQRGGSPTVVDHVRLFPRHSALRWEYRVHENILPSINRLGGEVRWTDVRIHHLGYLDDRLRERKRLRDQLLLLRNIEECPDDPFLHFNLGHSFIDAGDLDKAAHHLRESISRSEPHYSQVKKAYALLAQVERNRGRLEAALQVLDEGRRHHPLNAELLYFSGAYLHETRRLKEAAECFEQILATKTWPQEFGSFDIGILDHKARHRLAMVYADEGRTADAETILKDLRRTHPDYLPALLDLAEVLLGAGNGSAARELLSDLRAGGLNVEALALEGRLLLKEEKWAEALEILEKTIELEPRHEGAYSGIVVACQKLGRKDKAEEALRKRVRTHPRSAAAQYDLAKFLLENAGKDAALRQLDRALLLDPKHGPSLDMKVRILEDKPAEDSTR